MRLVFLVLLAVLANNGDGFRQVGLRRSMQRLSLRESKLRCESGMGASPPSPIPEDKVKEFDGIRQYKDIYGNLQVPDDFVVPTADFSWPEETWGMQLGKIVDTIKNTDEYDIYKEELERIGFRYSAPAPPATDYGRGKEGFRLRQYHYYWPVLMDRVLGL
jgi:hypothetical protein